MQTWTIRLYVDLADREAAEETMRSLLGQVVAAIDANRDLGGQALDASLIESTLGYSPEERTRLMRQCDCTLEVWSLM